MKQFFLFLLFFFSVETIFSQQQQAIEKNRFLKNEKGKFGVTDSAGKIIVPFVYDFIEYKNTRLIVSKKHSQGLLTTNNEVLAPVQYQFILPRKNNRFILFTQNSLWGLCDIDGKVMLPVKYKSISSTKYDEFYIIKNDKDLSGVYDPNGKNILPEVYRFYTIDNYKIFALKDNDPQILDLQHPGETIRLEKDITFIETQRHATTGEVFYQIVKKQNKYGVINANNQTVIPTIYDQVKSSGHWRYFFITINDKIGIINVDGKIVKEPIYDSVELRKEFVLLKVKSQKDESYFYKW